MNEKQKFALDELRERVAKLKGRATGDATDVVATDRFDRANWEEIRDFPAVQDFVTEMRASHDYVEDFITDIYQLVAKADPKLRLDPELKPTHRIHRPVMSAARGDNGIEELRTLTVNDPYAAAMGLVSMQPELRDVLDHLQRARDRAQEVEEKEQEITNIICNLPIPLGGGPQQGDDEGEGEGPTVSGGTQQSGEGEPGDGEGEGQPGGTTVVAGGGGIDTSEPTDDEIQEWIEKVEEAERLAAERDEAQAKADAAADKAARETREKISEAAKNAANERQAEDTMRRTYGLEDGPVKQMSFDERAELANLLANSRLKKFSDLIGQFRMMQAAESRKRVKYAPDEITNVHLSDDLIRLTSSEVMNLSTPELEDEFWLRFTERTLVTHELSGTEKLGQGPIIVVCDESESMEYNTVLGGTAEAWSKALSLALLAQAKQRGRDFIYIGFSSGRQQHKLVFPGGEGSLADVLKMTEHFYCGGTYYETPLQMAMETVLEYEAERKPKPDIVFITDQSYGHLNPDFVHKFNEVKARTSMRCFGIAVCAYVNGVLEAVCDNTRSITEMTSSPQEVADIFRAI